MSTTRWRTVALTGCAALAMLVPGTATAATTAQHGDDPDGVTWIRPHVTRGADHGRGAGHGHGAGHGPGGVTWVRSSADRPTR